MKKLDNKKCINCRYLDQYKGTGLLCNKNSIYVEDNNVCNYFTYRELSIRELKHKIFLDSIGFK